MDETRRVTLVLALLLLAPAFDGPVPDSLLASKRAAAAGVPVPVARQVPRLECGTVISEADVEKVCGAKPRLDVSATEQQATGQPVPFYCDRSFVAGDRRMSLVLDRYPDRNVGRTAFAAMYGRKLAGMETYEALTIADEGARYTKNLGAGTTETVTALNGAWRIAVSTSTVGRRIAPLCNAAQLEQLARLAVTRLR